MCKRRKWRGTSKDERGGVYVGETERYLLLLYIACIVEQKRMVTKPVQLSTTQHSAMNRTRNLHVVKKAAGFYMAPKARRACQKYISIFEL